MIRGMVRGIIRECPVELDLKTLPDDPRRMNAP